MTAAALAEPRLPGAIMPGSYGVCSSGQTATGNQVGELFVTGAKTCTAGPMIGKKRADWQITEQHEPTVASDRSVDGGILPLAVFRMTRFVHVRAGRNAACAAASPTARILRFYSLSR